MENLDTLSCIKIQGVSVLMEKDDEPIDKIMDPAGLWTDVDGQAARINEINLTDLKHCVEYFITQMNQNPEYISPAPPKKTAAPKYKPLFTKADIGSFVTDVTVAYHTPRQAPHVPVAPPTAFCPRSRTPCI